MKAAAGSPGGPAVTVCAWPRSGGGRGLRVAAVCGWPWSGVAVVCSWLRSVGGCSLRVAAVRGWPQSAGGRGLRVVVVWGGRGPRVAVVWGGRGLQLASVRRWPRSAGPLERGVGPCGVPTLGPSPRLPSAARHPGACVCPEPGARPRPAGDSRCQAVQRLGSEVQQGRLCGVRCGSRRSLPRGRGRRGS